MFWGIYDLLREKGKNKGKLRKRGPFHYNLGENIFLKKDGVIFLLVYLDMFASNVKFQVFLVRRLLIKVYIYKTLQCLTYS